MLKTSPVSPSDPNGYPITATDPSSAPTPGFTFIEVLIALLLCALLIGVLASAVIHLAQVDRGTVDLRAAALHLQTIACRHYIETSEPHDAPEAIAANWVITVDDVESEQESVLTPWHVWSAAPKNAQSPPNTISLRAGYEGW
jgi:Tfp pilus assembly protein PilV